jgi:hypothetical protein
LPDMMTFVSNDGTRIERHTTWLLDET